MPQIVHNLLCDPLFLPESALPHSSKSGPLLFCKQKGNLPMTQSLWTWRSLVLHSSAWPLPQGKPLQPQSDLSQGTETHRRRRRNTAKTENERAYLPFSWSKASVEKWLVPQQGQHSTRETNKLRIRQKRCKVKDAALPGRKRNKVPSY